jgi:protein YibB
MKELAIVTAFFNIKRADWKTFSRSSEVYLKYFSKWARIKNYLVIYLDSQDIKEEVIRLRQSYGLEKQTKVILINNIWNVDQLLYKSIQKATINRVQQNFRLRPNNPESWNADYNYIMLMKEWVITHAVENNYVKGKIAWIDFGFNHGNSLYTKEEDFAFLWKYDFDDKIYLFNLKELDDRPIFDIVRTMDTYIMGPIIIAPDFMWKTLWHLCRNSMLSLNEAGLVDDDQTILLMAYRKDPNIFIINKSNWFLPLKEYGGDHLSTKNSPQKKSFLIILFRKVKKFFRNLIYSLKQVKDLQETDL